MHIVCIREQTCKQSKLYSNFIQIKIQQGIIKIILHMCANDNAQNKKKIHLLDDHVTIIDQSALK